MTITTHNEVFVPADEGNMPFENNSHLKNVQSFYDQAGACITWAGHQYRRILARYYQRLIPANASVLEVGCGDGELLSHLANTDVTGVDLSPIQIALAQKKIPHGKFEMQSGEHLQLNRKFDYIVLSETVNQASDVQQIFEKLKTVSHPRTRLLLNFYNTAWRPLLSFATLLGFKAKQPASNWLNSYDVKNMLELAGWDVIKQQRRILLPLQIVGLDRLMNRFLAPLLPWFCLTTFQIARPISPPKSKLPSISVIIPARNEAGNIHAAIKRMPKLGSHTEVIFIEGLSKDNTWDEIQRVAREESDNWDIVTLQQTKKGKGNAVREAFDIAKGDILIILDADLTMPPEELGKFYDVLASGKAEFCNGVRLVYPMEKQAMRFLNLCANKFFGIVFTWALDNPIKDTLCGTKALYREDYLRIAANRSYFGEFDPFGDFDLLFGADHLLLKIVDMPIHYRDRTYGSTNISRWRHGVLLLRMLLVAIRKIKLG
ncbi:MAG: glycosyltransferase [Gammaproteobacteria bacterium]|nr:glycosyltransferase [Gammaproteobacteria bacterium]